MIEPGTDTTDDALDKLRDRLDVRCRRGGWDWSVTTDTGAACAWAATLRITPDPNHHGRADVSTVFYKAGCSTAGVALAEVFTAGILWAASQPPGPVHPGRTCDWVFVHRGHGYTLDADAGDLAGDWRCPGRDSTGHIPGGILAVPLGQRIDVHDGHGIGNYVTVLDVFWPTDDEGIVTYWTVEDGPDQPRWHHDDRPITAYDDAAGHHAAVLLLERARVAWRKRVGA